MDYQRRNFYNKRQEILDGGALREAVMETLDSAVAEAVTRLMARDYRAKCISEWCKVNLDLPISPDRIRGDDLEEVQETVRSRAASDGPRTYQYLGRRIHRRRSIP